MTPRVVAIDGAAGSGKSTLARGLASALGLAYLNTGIMYRALTFEALKRGVPLEDGDALASLMSTLRFSLGSGRPREIEVEGTTPAQELMSSEVEASVSQVSAHPQVRGLMRDCQRDLGREGGVVEGRDIAQVVFPEAPVKLYLMAQPAERAERRARERGAERDDVAIDLGARDARDATVNPSVPPSDATVIDTMDMDVEGTLLAALEIVARDAPELLA